MEYRSGVTGGPQPGVDIFPDLSLRAKPHCGVKCSQGLHFPATLFIGEQHSDSTSPKSNEGMRPSAAKYRNVTDKSYRYTVHMDKRNTIMICMQKNLLVMLNI